MMERLTEKQSSGYDLKAMNGEYCNRYCEQQRVETCNECVIYQAIQKLAEYEDFEEIFREKMTDTACEFLKDKEEFGKWLDRNKWITKKCDEYARAEEQGRLIKLPCKVGDTVYVPTRDFISELRIAHISVSENNTFFHWMLNAGIYPNLDGFSVDKIGKTVFITKSEAEQKLKEMESEQDGNT